MTIDERIAWAKKQRNIAYKKDSVQGIVYWDGYLDALKAVKEDADQRKHEQKQIEFERNEIAEIIANSFDHNGEKWDASDFEWSACQVQNAGYRKSTELAREIFEEIEKCIIEYYDKTITYSSPTLPYHCREAVGFSLNEMFMKIAELKKKYTGSENGNG